MGLGKDIESELELETFKVLLRSAPYNPMTYINFSKKWRQENKISLFFFFAIVIFISEMSVLGGATGAEYIIIFYL